MNTNNLKKFAQEARRKLITQVGARLEFVLTTDSAQLREKTEQLKRLREELNRTSREQLIEKVAYTWFNRFMALRFMDANDYQPLGIRIITPKEGYTIPELLEEAKRGNISEELPVKRQKVYDLLDNRIPSINPQNEAYKELLIAACNYLHNILPFLFERINDYTELLVPDDLTSEFSIVADTRKGILIEDCKEVEIIGWLYQYYISAENARLIESKKVYQKHEIAPASQLFTPNWIVRYMVDNTLGQLFTELYPSTNVTKYLEFYIHPAYKDQLQTRTRKKLEDIKFFDPCVGSAHILSYAFDVFYKVYQEQGYNETEISDLIIKHNLFGADIDERAAQLSSFVLMMKGRQYNKRSLKKDIRPNIIFYRDFEFDPKFKNASVLGSLIKVEPFEINKIKVDETSLFGEKQKELKNIYAILGQSYDLVVTNPPYISSSRMEGSLKQFVEANYHDTKYDLFATFIIRCLELCNDEGLTGYMSPFVWMFISSYGKLRETIISKHFINSLIQLEYSGFEGATVPVCTFTLRKIPIHNAKSSFIQLSSFKGSKNQAPKTLEAIRNPNCGWFFTALQKDFRKIPNCPIAYSLSEREILLFSKYRSIGEICISKNGITTSNNERFLRFWYEVNVNKIGFKNKDRNEAKASKYKWFPYNKGGEFRKWFGNLQYVVNWENDGDELFKYRPKATIRNPNFFFRESISWSDVTSSTTSFRFYPEGFAFDAAVNSSFFKSKQELRAVLAIINNKYYQRIAKILNPTLHFKIGNFESFPAALIDDTSRDIIINRLIEINNEDWNIRETSWNFKCIELHINVGNKDTDIEESFNLYKQYEIKNFFQVHKDEEELNKQFNLIHGLQEELSPNVPLEEITILQDELDRKSLAKLNKKLLRDLDTLVVRNYHDISLPFISKEVMAQYISYSVGCMFGRYSLEKEGLILANQGETLQDYLIKVSKSKSEITFLPDEDNIIPILEDEWFEDDIVNRFYKFLKVTFGEKNFSKNLNFLEEQIGKDIRKYFIRDFYPDHIRRYKKRPIYWMFSSPNSSFNVLIYMHRYTPDTISNILNKYLREFVGKLKTRREHLNHMTITGSPSEKTKAIKEMDSIDKMLIELRDYERDILYPLATERIAIDLDDGVLVNYNKFGKAVKEVVGLNDKKTKESVKKFDWIDTSQIL